MGVPHEVGERLLGQIFSPGIGGEVIYSFVIIVSSLLIYFGTKEIYELSSYKGLKYFRQAFLFFAIAYFFRTLIKSVILYFGITGIIEFSPFAFAWVGLLTQLAFVYFSSMSVFYLLYSVMWKRWGEKNKKIYFLHGLAVAIALVSIFLRDEIWYLVLNVLLAGIVVFVFVVSYRKKETRRKGPSLYIIYALWLFFWILNIVDALVPEFFQGLQLFVYLVSIFIFLLILYKVVRKTGSS